MYDFNNDMNLWECIADTLWTLSWYNDYADKNSPHKGAGSWSVEDTFLKEFQEKMNISEGILVLEKFVGI